MQAATDEKSLKASLDTNTISEANPGCTVLSNGEVNCTLSVYNDRKTWRKSRNNIDAQIQALRQKLEDLKEIRKHLKLKRPLPNSFDDFDDDINEPLESSTTEQPDNFFFDSFEQSSDSAENYTLTGSADKPKVDEFESYKNNNNSYKNYEQEERKEVDTIVTSQRSTRKKNKYSNSNISNFTSLIDYGLFETNTTSKPVQFTNHHRHHHRIYTPSSTTETPSSPPATDYEEIKSTTESTYEMPNKILNRVSIYRNKIFMQLYIYVILKNVLNDVIFLM